ncbi:hypothetical protein 56301_43 [Lactococcus phage 56301]|uniref:DUF7413 domain-containing protein n=1 Tax=Lactococcus phage 56301 TaxID=2029666 RepID=A0A343JPQ1_9CAUD|nr:hypothetical protein HYP32_gp43 [Lactococcus phage 56301]ASZ71474.1 hypothetical protein 56301_43 [Lactococcus phage 56301]
MLEYTSKKMAFQKITDEFIKVVSEKVKKLAGLIKKRNSRKKILESSYMKSNYKSLRAEEKASKHYARGVRKLSKELEEMNVTKYKAEPNECLYGLISELWSYWGKGYILPLLKYDIDISRQGDIFIIERGIDDNN